MVSFATLFGLPGARLDDRPVDGVLSAMGTVFAVLSLITAGSGVKPRHDIEAARRLRTRRARRRLRRGFAIHYCGVLWAYSQDGVMRG